jgi:hypothetical protein
LTRDLCSPLHFKGERTRASKKPYRRPAILRFRSVSLLFAVVGAASGAMPLAGQTPVPNPVMPSCSVPVVVDPASLPYSAPGIDTRSLNYVATVPAFPCYGKLMLPTGGQVPPSKIVWFSFAPAVSDVYRIDTLGSTPADYDTIVGVYTGGCGSLASVSGICGKSGFWPDDAPGSLQSSVTLNLEAGTTYTIAVGAIGALNSYSGEVEPSPGGTLRLNVARAAVAYPYAYLVPSLSHTGGFASDLYVTNVESADAQFVGQYLSHGNDGDQTIPARQVQSAPQIVLANGTRLYTDVVGLLGFADDWGALLLQSNRRLVAGAHTWTPAAGGTVGAYTPAIDVSPGLAAPEALAAGETGRFAGVREDASTRTNLVFANLSMASCALQAEVLDSVGAALGSAKTLRVPPFTAMQSVRLKDTFAISADVRGASVVIANGTPGCSVVGVAYVFDGNTTAGTNDPVSIPLRK